MKTIIILATILLTPWLAGAHILNLQTGEQTTLELMLDDLASARVVFVGELHDRKDHHSAQLDIIHSLRQRGLKVAIGLEMFQASHQYALDRWVGGDITESEFLPIYKDNWGMWQQYDDIFHYARREAVPLVGLNVDRDITRQVMQKGFASLEREQLDKLPMIRCDVDPLYKAYMRRALDGHLQGEKGFDFFCEAQLVWDKTMAHNLKDYLDRNKDVIVVVLAGTGHAWKHGIPAQLERLSDVPMRVVLPQLPGNLRDTMASKEETDYLLQGLEYGAIH